MRPRRGNRCRRDERRALAGLVVIKGATITIPIRVWASYKVYIKVVFRTNGRTYKSDRV